MTYAGIAAGVTVSLALTAAQDTKGAGKDTLAGFENLTGGSGNDTLTGDAKGNVINGGEQATTHSMAVPAMTRCMATAGVIKRKDAACLLEPQRTPP